MATITAIQRKFTFNSLELEDLGQGFTPDEVLEHYSGLYPELTNAKVINKGLDDLGNINFLFDPLVGTKG